ncbi:MAG TPA: TorF family putative porin [Gemmatimonadales bacterium]|nr:TorF family putative porin [Gemmatimonadales bacterium]
MPSTIRRHGDHMAVFTAMLSVALFFSPAPLKAQTEIGVDLGLFSSYVWRGVTTTNKPVMQPAAYLSIPVANASITLGAWSNFDLGKYDDPANDISESGGSSGFNFSEIDPYAEVSFPVGKTTLTGGVLGYVYPNSDSAPNASGLTTSDANTVEIYGKLGLDAPLSPVLSVYYDVNKVKGAYLEGALSYSLAASENISVDLGALAGFNAGRGIPEDPLSDEISNYEDDGFTHLDLSAGVPFALGTVSITPVVHFVVNGDDRTKATSPTNLNEDVKLWGGVSLSWSNTLGPEPPPDDES